MTRLETIGFIEYLRNKKTDVIIDKQVFNRQTSMFGKFVKTDLGFCAKELLNIIKECPSPAEAYKRIAHEKGKQNMLWKTFREGSFMYKEDFDEYLEQNPEESKNPVIVNWLKHQSFETRDVFKKFFPTEYAVYIYHYTTPGENPFVVTMHNDKGVYNVYRIEKQRVKKITDGLGYTVPKVITLGYKSTSLECGLDAMIPLAQFMCTQLNIDKVLLADYDSEDIVAVDRFAADNCEEKDTK